MDSRRSLIWTRDEAAEEFEGEELLTVDVVDLLTAFRRLLHRLGEEARLQMHRDTTTYLDSDAAGKLKMREYYEWVDRNSPGAPDTVPKPHFNLAGRRAARCGARVNRRRFET